VIFGFCVFVTILVISFSLDTLNAKKNKTEGICSVNDYISSLVSYIQHNGRTEFADELPHACAKLQTDFSQVYLLRSSLSEFLQNCKPKVSEQSFRKEIENPIITIITSWNTNTEKQDFLNRSISNWNLLKPDVNIVMFTNSAIVGKLVLEKGWTVFPIIHHVPEGLPVLRSMFQMVKNTFNTTFYGFFNNEILFTDNFLESILLIYKAFPTYENLLLTGRRTHIPSLTRTDLSSYSSLTRAAMERGLLSKISSVGYLISNDCFPWDEIADFIVERSEYGNWLVAHARCNGVKVIDMTNTILAIDPRSVEEFSLNISSKNIELSAKKWSQQDLRRGYIVCPEWHSYYTLCGDIEIAQRTYTPPYCDCF